MKEIVSRKYLPLTICLLLLIANLVVFSQVKNYPFCNLDDPVYVTKNPHIQSGLTVNSITWAFTTSYAYFWHPLTWLSLMTDYHFFGFNPAGYHVTNLLFHIVSTILLFLILRHMTQATWQSALTAMFFAVHPLHVESVVWVSERKDVLSTLFWMLTMGAYVKYCERPGAAGYALILILFTLGLMAKPMLVSLPFILLLLDYWPLGRLKLPQREAGGNAPPVKKIENIPAKRKQKNKVRQGQPQTVSREVAGTGVPVGTLIKEKLPLFLLAFLFALIALYAQPPGGGESANNGYPLPLRIANASLSFVRYLLKMIWPARMAVFYPFPASIPLWQSLGSAILLLLATFLIVRASMKRPYLAVGWFWYLGTLVPVSGIVQVGNHAMADRYTYVPLIGIFIMIIWGIADVARMKRLSHRLLSGFSLAAVILLIVISRRQVGLWESDITLFEHALKVTSGNYAAHNNLGVALREQGKDEEALFHYQEALRLNPASFKAHFNLANILAARGKQTEAISHYQEALKLNKEYVNAHRNLGTVLSIAGRYPEAIAHYREALVIDSSDPVTYYNLGMALFAGGQADEAAAQLKKALEIKPDFPEAYNELGRILAVQGKTREAIEYFRRALWLKPDFPAARQNLETAIKSR